MKFVVYFMTLIAATLGTVLALWIISIDLIGIDEIVIAVAWFLISFVTYYVAKRIDNEGWFTLVSLDFILTWAFCTVGVLLGYIVWELIKTGSVSISYSELETQFFNALPLAIGPTATASLGLRE